MGLALLGVLGGACGGRSGWIPLDPPLDAGVVPDRAVIPPASPDRGAAPDTAADLARADARADASATPGPEPTAKVPGLWVTVAPGTFQMGSPAAEPCRLSNEVRHDVTLSRAFRISTTEVTQAQFRAVLGHEPSQFSACGANCPVDSVSWSDAVAYCNTLSKLAGLERCYSCDAEGGQYAYPYRCVERGDFRGEGSRAMGDCRGYRLPSEAEWEYAYRAGTSTALYNGRIEECSRDPRADAAGWYHYTANHRTHLVGRKRANAWRLYDMAGNAWEWVNDHYQANLGSEPARDPAGPAEGSTRVIKGGGWSVSAGGLRGAARNHLDPQLKYPMVGFRCLRSVSF